MRARTGLWDPRVGNDPGPPGPNRVAPISLRASVQSTACMDFFWSPCIYNHYEESCPRRDVPTTGNMLPVVSNRIRLGTA
jgi:hypothetical protein